MYLSAYPSNKIEVKDNESFLEIIATLEQSPVITKAIIITMIVFIICLVIVGDIRYVIVSLILFPACYLLYKIQKRRADFKVKIDKKSLEFISVPDKFKIQSSQIKNVEITYHKVPFLMTLVNLYGTPLTATANRISIKTESQDKVLHGYFLKNEEALKVSNLIKGSLGLK